MRFPFIIGVICCIFCCSFGVPSYVDEYELSSMKAAGYLFSKADPGWSDFIPRSLTAASFIERLNLHERSSPKNGLKKELLKLLQDKGVKEVPAQQLSTYINGLYAMCEDPRDFAGSDLIDLLRDKFDKADKTSFRLPIVILSLCIARETSLEDIELLIKMFDDKKNDNAALKALILITMAKCKELSTIPYLNEMSARLSDFVKRYKGEGGTGIATKALIIQAYNAWGIDTSALRQQLLALQVEDGSFGDDLPATCAAIPALMNSSLADLQCKSRIYKVKPKKSSDLVAYKPKNVIDLTLDIPYGQNIGTHTIKLAFNEKKNLYELMSIAQEKNQLYSFRTEELEGTGKKIAAVAGISNDPESGMNWILYKMDDNKMMNDMVNDVAVDYIYPQDGDHYILQLKME